MTAQSYQLRPVKVLKIVLFSKKSMKQNTQRDSNLGSFAVAEWGLTSDEAFQACDWQTCCLSRAQQQENVCSYLPARCLGQCSRPVHGLHEKQAEEPTFTTSWSKSLCFPLKYSDTVVKRSPSYFWRHRNKHRCDAELQRYRAAKIPPPNVRRVAEWNNN